MIKKFYTNIPILNFDYKFLKDNNITKIDLRKHFPRYILETNVIEYGLTKRIFITVIRIMLQFFVWVILRPRLGRVGELNLEEVDKVYSREAFSYNLKHHITTRGMDLVWRRSCGWFLSTMDNKDELKILDLCTGTGLTTQEVASILNEFYKKAKIIALDYNVNMLSIAKKTTASEIGNIKIEYCMGDAMNLHNSTYEVKNDLETFDYNVFDAIIQMFGIGGIKDPLKVLDGVLKILKPGGYFFLIDMHNPVANLPGEIPFLFFKWLRMPVFESLIYKEGTIPLVLKRLWGWRDPTPLFYLISLITYRDDKENFWGFRKKYFFQESKRWWLSLPVMSVAELIVEKVQLSKEEAERRKIILNSYKYNL